MENNKSTEIESYLSFKLMNEIFAINVGKVLEILEMMTITRVPKVPGYMRGVINLRGSVLPVIDTRQKFGFPLKENTIDTCIVVLDIQIEGESVTIGALVDGVSEVLSIKTSEIEPPPSIGIKYKSEFIDGMWKREEAFIMLLNIDKVFTQDEVSILVDQTQKSKAPAKKTRKKNPPKKE